MSIKKNIFQIILEAAAAVISVFPIVYLATIWSSLPEKIPGHYNVLGEVDRWGSKTELLILPIFGLAVWGLLTLVSYKPKWWNMPIDYEKRSEQSYTSTLTMILELKVIVVATFAFLTYSSATASSLPWWFIPAELILIGVVLIVGIIKVVKSGK